MLPENEETGDQDEDCRCDKSFQVDQKFSKRGQLVFTVLVQEQYNIVSRFRDDLDNKNVENKRNLLDSFLQGSLDTLEAAMVDASNCYVAY